VGLALAQAPTSHQKGDGNERAKRALKKAIALDHGALRPLFALVDLHSSEGDYDTCLQLLQNAIENGGKVTDSAPLSSVCTWNKEHADVIQAKMAEIHTLNEEFGEALECYHTAIAMNPQNGLAARGLERIEKILKGIDPDEEEEFLVLQSMCWKLILYFHGRRTTERCICPILIEARQSRYILFIIWSKIQI
jgi:anaphase-promoting complex subunit 7